MTKTETRSRSLGTKIGLRRALLYAGTFSLFYSFTLPSAAAQTTVYLLRKADGSSPLSLLAEEGNSYGCAASTTKNHLWLKAGTSSGTGLATNAFAPSSAAPPCLAANQLTPDEYLMWITAPVSTQVTISGNISGELACAESATALNAGARFVVKHWSRRRGGIVGTIWTSGDTTECSTSLADRTISASAPASTTLQVGDRIAIFVEVRNVGGGWGGNGSRTFTLGFSAASGTGDTRVVFTENISFAADTNNARAVVN